ncbi:hypothetical protein [Afifella sp. IM 167]|uniref:hypothetical protein n=1 Tax=Afifella sp. IM 167 TaxID=2033586 RepID=UPI001CCD0625|nr:hypothetical protein [Afifella sp. IM 167]
MRLLSATHERPGVALTVVSGEIHLATRGTLVAKKRALHQLVVSGITHPPPKAWALSLSALARLGEAPLKDHPIRLHPPPQPRRGLYGGAQFSHAGAKGRKVGDLLELESGATGRMGM